MRWKSLLYALAFALLALASPSSAEVVEDVHSRGNRIRLLVGVPASPVAVVVLFAGGHGALDIQPDGRIAWGAGNFLVRTRHLFQRQGMITAVIDAPTDKLASGLYHFRDGEQHAEDIAAVILRLREKFDLPVWLVGTSRGTESVANAAIRLETSLPDGIVLTSSMLRHNRNGAHLLAMDLDRIRIPTLIVHHVGDECSVTPYDQVESLREELSASPTVEVLEYEGGFPQGKVCGAYHYHGYRGIEETVVADIGAWIKARQIARM